MKEIVNLDKETTRTDFWDDNESAQKLLQKRSTCQRVVKVWEDLHKECENAGAFLELVEEAGDESLLIELESAIKELEVKLASAEVKAILSGESEFNNAIVSINSGAGGTESQDGGQMLLRMYRRWGERSGYKAEILDVQHGEEAGIKSATLEILGEHAYGYLKSERGVHRLVRLSPFDADHARHTSFALTEILPEVAEVEVSISQDDLRMDTFGAGGHGGQNVQRNANII